MNETAVTIGFLIIFAVGETLFRKKILSNEHARKFTHVISGLWTLFTPFLISFSSIMWIGIAFAILLAFLYQKTLLSSISMSERKTFGSITMPLGIAAAAGLVPSLDVFIPSIGVLTFADAAAGLSGKRASKSVAGSVTFLLVALFTLIVTPSLFALQHVPILQASLIALCLTIVEYVSPLGFDNLTVPVAAAFLLNSLTL